MKMDSEVEYGLVYKFKIMVKRIEDRGSEG